MMKTNSIIAIEELHKKISEKLTEYRKFYIEQGTNMDNPVYGSEKEYSLNAIIYSVQNILSDVSYLVRSHNIFLSIYTYNERENIKNNLNQLFQHLHNRNHAYVVSHIEQLKSLLRIWNIRVDKRTLEGYNEELERTREIKANLDNDFVDIQLLFKNVNDVYHDIQDSKSKLETTIEDLKKKQENLKSVLADEEEGLTIIKKHVNQSITNEQTISQNLEKTKFAKQTFDEFVAKISEREEILQKQAEQTEKYNEALNNYSNEYANKLDEAEKLILAAKEALHFKNAEGLSAAFSTQLDDTRKWWKTIGWIVGSVLFLLGTILIGIWIISGWGINTETTTESQMLFNLIGRLSMIPFTISGAIFCANQYTKQKNLIEDYAYKTTIAKSIIAFSEELRTKDSERYAEYISTILKEIHQDPLRKRGKNSDEFSLDKDSTGLIEKLIATLHSTLLSK